MYSLHLSAEQLEFRDTVRSFVDGEIKPVVLKADRLDADIRAVPMDVLDKAAQMGLRTLALPEDLGGVGADALTCCLVAEELAAGDAGIAAVLAETMSLGGTLFAAMDEMQRGRFLKPFLELVFSRALNQIDQPIHGRSLRRIVAVQGESLGDVDLSPVPTELLLTHQPSVDILPPFERPFTSGCHQGLLNLVANILGQLGGQLS